MIDAYDLGTGFDAGLEALWTAEGDEPESPRSLADRFNRRLLEAEMADAGTSTLDGEVRNFYRLLTSDGASSGVRTEARKRLERDGIDVGELERDLVSYQAIRSYLEEYRGAEYGSHGGSERLESVVATTERLQSRIRSVVEKNLGQLRDTDRLTLGELRLFVGTTSSVRTAAPSTASSNSSNAGDASASNGDLIRWITSVVVLSLSPGVG